MQLQLKYPPTPENAPKHALLAVEAVRNIERLELDYTPDSLAILDQVVEAMRQNGVTEAQVATTLFVFGCYVGEVFVRHAKGIWRREEDTTMRGIGGFFLVIELPANSFCNPIGKVFKRLRDGETESLPYFYAVFSKNVS